MGLANQKGNDEDIPITDDKTRRKPWPNFWKIFTYIFWLEKEITGYPTKISIPSFLWLKSNIDTQNDAMFEKNELHFSQGPSFLVLC